MTLAAAIRRVIGAGTRGVGEFREQARSTRVRVAADPLSQPNQPPQ
jgi:hypothetical protein